MRAPPGPGTNFIAIPPSEESVQLSGQAMQETEESRLRRLEELYLEPSPEEPHNLANADQVSLEEIPIAPYSRGIDLLLPPVEGDLWGDLQGEGPAPTATGRKKKTQRKNQRAGCLTSDSDTSEEDADGSFYLLSADGPTSHRTTTPSASQGDWLNDVFGIGENTSVTSSHSSHDESTNGDALNISATSL